MMAANKESNKRIMRMVKSMNLVKILSPGLIAETERDGGAVHRLQGHRNQYDVVLEKRQQRDLFLPPKRTPQISAGGKAFG